VKGFNTLVFDDDGVKKLMELNKDTIREIQEEAFRKGRESALRDLQELITCGVDYQKNQDKLNRYAETVGQYNSRKKVNKAISKMKKSDDPNKKEKLQILRAQAAKFKNKKKKK
jgi:hypothetical protein